MGPGEVVGLVLGILTTIGLSFLVLFHWVRGRIQAAILPLEPELIDTGDPLLNGPEAASFRDATDEYGTELGFFVKDREAWKSALTDGMGPS